MNRKMVTITHSPLLWHVLVMILLCCVCDAGTEVGSPYFSTSIFPITYKFSTRVLSLIILKQQEKRRKEEI